MVETVNVCTWHIGAQKRVLIGRVRGFHQVWQLISRRHVGAANR